MALARAVGFVEGVVDVGDAIELHAVDGDEPVAQAVAHDVLDRCAG